VHLSLSRQSPSKKIFRPYSATGSISILKKKGRRSFPAPLTLLKQLGVLESVWVCYFRYGCRVDPERDDDRNHRRGVRHCGYRAGLRRDGDHSHRNDSRCDCRAVLDHGDDRNRHCDARCGYMAVQTCVGDRSHRRGDSRCGCMEIRFRGYGRNLDHEFVPDHSNRHFGQSGGALSYHFLLRTV